MNARNQLVFFLKGMLMGLADIIPGISGGTIALITGIYERLVFSIKDIDFQFVPLALTGKLARARENLSSIDFSFFIPLLSGIALSFLFFSNIIHYCLSFYPIPTFAFFFGLILTSAKIVFAKIKKKSLSILVFFVSGFLFAFFFTGLNPLQTNHSPLTIFFSGMIAICAMILPGISGAFILLFIGQYEFLLEALRELNLSIIFLFVIGAFIGIVFFSRLLAFLLKTHENKVMAFLTGLMLGALRIPFSKMAIAFNLRGMGFSMAFALSGVLVVLLLERFASKKKAIKYN